MGPEFFSLGMILEGYVQRVLPWQGLAPIIEAIAQENNE